MEKVQNNNSKLNIFWKKITNFEKVSSYFFLSFVLFLVIDSLSRHSLFECIKFIFTNPLVALVNYLIIASTTLLGLVFKRRCAGLSIISIVWLLLGIVECVILIMRVTPLSAMDLIALPSAISIALFYFTIIELIGVILLIVLLILGCVLLFIKAKQNDIHLTKFAVAFLSSVLSLGCLLIICFTSGKIKGNFTNLNEAYDEYGFIYCFTVSIVDRGVDKPSDYSKELIDEITNQITLPNSVDGSKPNVVVVQLESFFDVNYINNTGYSSNPIPFFTELRANHLSGIFEVPVIGAGTINTEFEVLTGLNMNHLGASEYPYLTILLNQTCETIAYDLKASGYKTHAIHNNRATFYQRNNVYQNLGFDDFTSIEYFLNEEYNDNNWAKDTLITREIMSTLNSTSESDFVFAISVQGHGAYPNEYELKENDIYITDYNFEDEILINQYNYYINQLREMDIFIKELYNEIMNYDEDTVLVLYGDHLPNIAKDVNIELSISDYQTEYIVVTNYDIENKELSIIGNDIQAYLLFPGIMELIGNNTGTINKYHRQFINTNKYQENLEKLAYDGLHGEKYAYDDFYNPVETKLGHLKIEITNCYIDDKYLYVLGNNFTHSSIIVLNEKDKKETEFIDNQTLRIPLEDIKLEDLEFISVHQVAGLNSTLTETEQFEYKNK